VHISFKRKTSHLIKEVQWLFGLEFPVDVTDRLNNLYMKLQDKNKCFPNFSKWYYCIQDEVETAHIAVRKWGYEPTSLFKEVDWMCYWFGNLRKCTEKNNLLQDSFQNRFCDIAEEDWILAFINPFSLSEQKIMKVPNNIQMAFIDYGAIWILKTKYDELSSLPRASEIPVSGDPYNVKISQN